jgi:hypothetical protein
MFDFLLGLYLVLGLGLWLGLELGKGRFKVRDCVRSTSRFHTRDLIRLGSGLVL